VICEFVIVNCVVISDSVIKSDVYPFQSSPVPDSRPDQYQIHNFIFNLITTQHNKFSFFLWVFVHIYPLMLWEVRK
jgi:hypothetical protein